MEDLVNEERSYISVRKGLKDIRKKYHDKIDDLCYLLKKRLDRHDIDSDDDEYQPLEKKFKVQ